MTNRKVPDPKKINDPDKCLAIMKNIKRHRDGTKELYAQFFRRYVELKASEHETNSHVVKQYYKFLYAYEQALAEKHQGKRRPKATRIRTAIRNRKEKKYNGNLELSIIDFLTFRVTNEGTTEGFEFLISTDQAELTAEHLVKSNHSYFSEVAVAAAIKKLDNWAPSRDVE